MPNLNLLSFSVKPLPLVLLKIWWHTCITVWQAGSPLFFSLRSWSCLQHSEVLQYHHPTKQTICSIHNIISNSFRFKSLLITAYRAIRNLKAYFLSSQGQDWIYTSHFQTRSRRSAQDLTANTLLAQLVLSWKHSNEFPLLEDGFQNVKAKSY